MIRIVPILLSALLVLSCYNYEKNVPDVGRETFTNPIYPAGSSPRLIRFDGHYYYTQSMNDRVSVWKADHISDIAGAKEHVIFSPGSASHISAPQLHHIDGKWYVMFSADDGSGRDIRHIYVMENPSRDPLEGSFTMKGWIKTGNVKDIHPTTFTHDGKRYLLWSGTDSVVPGKATVWNICIAPMTNPWTIEGTPRVISTPQYEWECQWIDEDGTSYPAPSLVNEGPEFLYSRDSTRLLVYYAASETYTSYYCEGLLMAPAGADPLEPSSWHKSPEPVFSKNEGTGVLGPGHVSFYRTREQLYILYNGKSRFPDMRAVDNRSPRMQEVKWGKDGVPVLGFPVREDSLLYAPTPEE
ncbi:MAG: glycoside hydrolase family 43 protein [Bacteroidales bacterium]|nr:glycoside hydrolase family 43 protein [Bacteroidales bacterium]